MQQLLMRRPNLDDLPEIPPLPIGYTLRQSCMDDLPALTRVLDLAFPTEAWTPEKVHRALIADTTVQQVYVVEHNGTIVATAAVRLLPEEYPGSGYVHWVGADPAHRGRKLGYVVTLATLYEFVGHGCRDAVLETNDFRIPAIKTYLNLGFEPVYRDETHHERWAQIQAQLAGK